MTRTLLRNISTVSAAVGISMLAMASAHADVIFATFSPATNTPVYSFDNATGTFSGASISGFFIFHGITPPGASAVEAATLNFTSTAGPIQFGTGTSTTDIMQVTGINFSVTRNSDNALLLGIAGTGVIKLDGTNTPNQTTFGGDVNGGDTVNYTSDFYNFTNTTQRSFGVQATGNTPNYSRANVTDGRPASFTTGGSFDFSSNPAPVVVPEAGTAGLLMGALPLVGAVAFVARRRKK